MVNGVGVDKKKFDIEINEKEKQKLREDLGISPKDFLCINIVTGFHNNYKVYNYVTNCNF